MKLVIDGREYDGKLQPFLGDLRLLKPQFGFGYGTVIKRLEGLGGKDASFLDDEEKVEALIAWMWVVRLRSGERDVTVEQVRMTPLDAFEWIAEDGDTPATEAVEAPDPHRAPTGSGRGAATGRPRKGK